MDNNFRFRLTNERKISKTGIFFVFIETLACYFIFYKSFQIANIFEIKIGGLLILLFLLLIYLISMYTYYNLLKIIIMEMYFTQEKKLYIKYYFLRKLKEKTLDLNELFFRLEPRLNHNQEIVILDKNYKRLFKIRGSNGIGTDDLNKIAISFRNADIKEHKRKLLDKKAFLDDWKIIYINYFSKDIFRNFWYI